MSFSEPGRLLSGSLGIGFNLTQDHQDVGGGGLGLTSPQGDTEQDVPQRVHDEPLERRRAEDKWARRIEDDEAREVDERDLAITAARVYAPIRRQGTGSPEGLALLATMR